MKYLKDPVAIIRQRDFLMAVIEAPCLLDQQHRRDWFLDSDNWDSDEWDEAA